jgi:hypothetical protein
MLQEIFWSVIGYSLLVAQLLSSQSVGDAGGRSSSCLITRGTPIAPPSVSPRRHLDRLVQEQGNSRRPGGFEGLLTLAVKTKPARGK